MTLFFNEEKEELCTVIETRDPALCQQHLVNFIDDLRRQNHQYILELEEQSRLCLIRSISFAKIEIRLVDWKSIEIGFF